MAVREHWEIKWIKWIAVQGDWVTQVSSADTVNIVWWWTVTDVGWVATINIPEWVTWYREDVTAGSATYTFVNSPATSTSFLVFTDSWTLLFSGIDYTYDPDTETITFLSLWATEKAYIWVAHAVTTWWWIGDMVKAVYDPTNINSSAFDMDNFVDWTNKHYVSTAEKTKIANALEWPASSTDWNIVVFDGATGKVVKDSWLKIQTTSSIPVWASICDVYYNNGTIYLYTNAVRDNIILES
jgi:hypothetical protein